MFSSEWSLVLFTILVQTAAGMVVISETTRIIAGESCTILRWQTPVACLLTGLGLVLSLTHLGNPIHCVYTILDLGTSWLSREILSVGVFFWIILLLAWMRRKSPEVKATPLALAAIAMGLCTVFVMTRVYMLETVPVWNSAATPFGFFGTMFLSGAVVSGLITAVGKCQKKGGNACGSVIRIGCFAALFGLGLIFIGIVLGMVALNTVDSYGVNALSMVSHEGLGGLVARMVMICVGAGIFSWSGLKAMGKKRPVLTVNPALCALVLVLAGEIIGRLMFYGTYLRIGI